MSAFVKGVFLVAIVGFAAGNVGVALWLTGSVLRVSVAPVAIMAEPIPVAIAIAESSIGALVFATYTPIAVLSLARLFESTSRGYA